MLDSFTKKLIKVAQAEFDRFHETNETEEPLRSRIDTYCDGIGVARPDDISEFAWSATFVSWCIKTAGATAEEFKFSIRHSEFAQAAIRNADQETGVFRARRIDAYAPKIGDLIQSNREGGRVDYDEARSRSRYPSHSAIVVELGNSAGNRFAVTIGGNESDSVRRTRVPLTASGMVKQRPTNPYICVIETLKTDAVGTTSPLLALERVAIGPSPMLLRLAGPGYTRAKGPVVEMLQNALGSAGFPVAIDGDFGPDTLRALNAWQRSTGHAETVGISGPEWNALTGRPVPSLFDLALQFTASFEGTGFTGAVGNFDGAGITFGIIGFTARHGELRRILEDARSRDPALLQRCFGELAQDLIDGLSGTPTELIDFANSISIPSRKYKLQPAWRAAFEKFGNEPIVRQLQLDAAEQRYWSIAKRLFRTYRLGDVRDAALLYDCAVQNGGVKPDADAAIRNRLPSGHTPEARRLIIAEEVRDTSNPRWQDDVFSRKACIATGEGRVHGARFDLLDWGLGTEPIGDAELDARSQLGTHIGVSDAAPGADRPEHLGAAFAAVELRSYYPHWVWRRGQVSNDILARLPAGAIIGVHHVWGLEDIKPILDFPDKGFQISWYAESNTRETDGEEPDVVGKPVKSRIAEAQRKQAQLVEHFGAHRFAGLIELDAARDKAEGDLEGPGNQQADFLKDAKAVKDAGFLYLAKNLSAELVDTLRAKLGSDFVPRCVLEDVTAPPTARNQGYRADAKDLADRGEILTLVVHEGRFGGFRATSVDEATAVISTDFGQPKVEVYWGRDKGQSEAFCALKSFASTPPPAGHVAAHAMGNGALAGQRLDQGEFVSRSVMLSRALSSKSSPVIVIAGEPRRLNASPDAPDLRDRHYLPTLRDLSACKLPPRYLVPLNQGQEGACTGFALAAAIDILNAERRLQFSNGQLPDRVSPRMLYEMAKLHDEWPGKHYSGSSIRGAMKGFFHNGVCSEMRAPYKVDEKGWTLSVEQAKEARSVALGAYFRLLPDATHYHAALNEVSVICASARVHEGWRAPVNGRILPSRTYIGGHAFAIVGYDETGFFVQNSWGPTWGVAVAVQWA